VLRSAHYSSGDNTSAYEELPNGANPGQADGTTHRGTQDVVIPGMDVGGGVWFLDVG
jgi:hypothetical protein